MLGMNAINLDDLVQALEDHSALEWGSSWVINRSTGEVFYHSGDSDDQELDDDEDLRSISPLPSHVGYGDMEDFIELLPDSAARNLLERSIEGRGAFRRFKDTLYEFPELREEWFAFHDARVRRGAIEWLLDEDLIAEEDARAAAGEHPDPPVGGAAQAIPRGVADDLRRLYGQRLVEVRVFGSQVRDDATPESDLDLLVVLDDVDDPWAEHRRMDPVLWQHTSETGTVITAIPVGRQRLEQPDDPVLIRAAAESRPV